MGLYERLLQEAAEEAARGVSPEDVSNKMVSESTLGSLPHRRSCYVGVEISCMDKEQKDERF